MLTITRKWDVVAMSASIPSAQVSLPAYIVTSDVTPTYSKLLFTNPTHMSALELEYTGTESEN